MAKLSIEFNGFDEVLKKLNELNADTKNIADEALRKTHEIVTKKAKRAIQKGNLPAHGKYSSGLTEDTLVTEPKITWNGTEGSVKVGFDIYKGGLPSIFMMYGTPRYMKVQELYDAFWGEQTEGEIALAQQEVFTKAMEKYL